jgi:hypothetical protein
LSIDSFLVLGEAVFLQNKREISRETVEIKLQLCKKLRKKEGENTQEIKTKRGQNFRRRETMSFFCQSSGFHDIIEQIQMKPYIVNSH